MESEGNGVERGLRLLLSSQDLLPQGFPPVSLEALPQPLLPAHLLPLRSVRAPQGTVLGLLLLSPKGSPRVTRLDTLNTAKPVSKTRVPRTRDS